MSNYTKITLDTIGPSGVTVVINDGAAKTTSATVTLKTTCADNDTTGYQMKIWGVSGAETEDSAAWETYQETKTVTLTESDGAKKIYVRLRDDLWNESEGVSDTITLATSVPIISDFVISPDKISLVDRKNVGYGSFHFDEPIDAVKVMLVDSINAAHNAATNISIPVTNGSYLYDEVGGDAFDTTVLEYESTGIDSLLRDFEFVVYGADILAVSPGDGVKKIKAFVRSASSGNWSV